MYKQNWFRIFFFYYSKLMYKNKHKKYETENKHEYSLSQFAKAFLHTIEALQGVLPSMKYSQIYHMLGPAFLLYFRENIWISKFDNHIIEPKRSSFPNLIDNHWKQKSILTHIAKWHFPNARASCTIIKSSCPWSIKTKYYSCHLLVENKELRYRGEIK